MSGKGKNQGGKKEGGKNQEITDTISFICRNDRPACTQCSYILDKNVEKEKNKEEKIFTGEVYSGTSNGLQECNKFCPKNPLPDGKPCPNDGDNNTKTRTDSDIDDSPPPKPKGSPRPGPRPKGSPRPGPRPKGSPRPGPGPKIVQQLGDNLRNVMSNMRALATDFVDNSSIEKSVLTGIGISVIILLIIGTLFGLF